MLLPLKPHIFKRSSARSSLLLLLWLWPLPTVDCRQPQPPPLRTAHRSRPSIADDARTAYRVPQPAAPRSKKQEAPSPSPSGQRCPVPRLHPRPPPPPQPPPPLPYPRSAAHPDSGTPKKQSLPACSAPAHRRRPAPDPLILVLLATRHLRQGGPRHHQAHPPPRFLLAASTPAPSPSPIPARPRSDRYPPAPQHLRTDPHFRYDSLLLLAA